MRGASGAIDHVRLEQNTLVYTTIGGEKPLGICGSDLMDLTALLLTCGIMDESGRILSPEELETPQAKANAHRIIEINHMPAFCLADREESDSGQIICLTQKDIREIQLAKGAMAAGMELMCRQLGIGCEDIQEVLFAGAFGNYMSPDSACAIGLIPSLLRNRITAVGNAAGEGAKIALVNQREFALARKLTREIEFLELAKDPEFQDCFVDHLEFPEQQ